MKRIITIIAMLAFFVANLQAQIVGATNNSPQQKPSKKTKTENSLYKPTGHYLRFEAGYPQFASVAYGYQLNPNIMFGGGVGYGIIASRIYENSIYTNPIEDTLYNYLDITNASGIPFFAEVTFSTPSYDWSLMLDVKMGINIPLTNSHALYHNYYAGYVSEIGYSKSKRFFGAINLGVAFRNFSIWGGVSSNNPKWYSFFISYNLPLKVH